jgi:hypothetical protein
MNSQFIQLNMSGYLSDNASDLHIDATQPNKRRSKAAVFS